MTAKFAWNRKLLPIYPNPWISIYGSIKIIANSKEKDNIINRVSDKGFGISEKDLKRIFEPFFTTKTNKRGTGLGLSITFGLVQEIGSSINISSENGKGRDFTANPFKIELLIEKILSSLAHVPTGTMAHER